jgi:hypothetical protein
MRGGTLLEMSKTAIERKQRIEATASLFKCKICNVSVPSTKINLAETFPNGELNIIHACDDCMQLVALSEAKRKEKKVD